MQTKIENIVRGQLRATQHKENAAGWDLPMTSAHDVELALKSLRAHRPRPLPETVALLSSIGREATWITEAHLLEIAKRSGSPIKYLRYSVRRFNEWLAGIEQYVRCLGETDRFGTLHR